MADFTRCPAELLAAIMGQCESLGDVKSLILACSRNHAVWLAHAPVIIAAAAPRTVLLFDEALMAASPPPINRCISHHLQARATEMVHKAELAAHLPPAIDPKTLSVSCRLPTPAELTAVVDPNRFAEYIQARYCKVFDDSQQLEEMYYEPNGRWPKDRNRVFGGGDESPEEPEGMPQWTERFRRAIYTALLLGAGLARPYQEPFPPGEAHRRGKVPTRLGAWRFDPSSWEGEVAHLRQFPVFDFINEDGGRKAVLGNIARWLVVSTLERIRGDSAVMECPRRSLLESRAHWGGSLDENDVWAVVMMLQREDKDLFDEFPLGSRAECEGVVWVVMQTVQMFEFLLKSVVDHSTEVSLGREPDLTADKTIASHGSSQRTVNVVLLGAFWAETIILPDEAGKGPLYARLAASPADGQHEFANIPGALTNVYCDGRVLNILNDYEAPPPPLQFYTYLLRAHCGLHFIPSTFDMVEETRRQLYRQFKWRANIFANHFDDVPERTWIHREVGIERRLIDVTMGAEILKKYKAAVPGARRMACDPRTFDDFASFR